jgi:5-methylcytosine-specific restriction endonuclease McrA
MRGIFFRYFGRIKTYGIAYYLSANYRRLIKYEQHRKNTDKYGAGFLSSRATIKGQIILKNGSKCNVCKIEFVASHLSIDHIVPIFMGGTNNKKNLQLLCEKCHRLKTSKDDEIRKTREGWIKAGILKAKQ